MKVQQTKNQISNYLGTKIKKPIKVKKAKKKPRKPRAPKKSKFKSNTQTINPLKGLFDHEGYT